MSASLEEICETFALLDDWEDRYRYLIELGRALPDMPLEAKIPENIVHGCQSLVWIRYRLEHGRLVLELDSDALIVRGLIVIVLAAFNGLTPAQIMRYDIDALFEQLALKRHLSPTRGNGLAAMVARIQKVASQHVSAAGETSPSA